MQTNLKYNDDVISLRSLNVRFMVTIFRQQDWYETFAKLQLFSNILMVLSCYDHVTSKRCCLSFSIRAVVTKFGLGNLNTKSHHNSDLI